MSNSATERTALASEHFQLEKRFILIRDLGECVRVTGQVFATLGFQSELLPHEIEENLRHVWTLSRSAQDRAVALMNSPKLHSWLSSTEPSALFVNGNYDAAARQSPLTYVCTKLMDTICPGAALIRPRCSPIVGQAFFCGHHIDVEDPTSGPVKMMRDLVSQLVMSYRPSVHKMQQMLELDASDMQELCITYASLIKQLPQRYMVLCIIDGIAFYEDSPTEYEAATEAVRHLLEVMESCKRKGCLFKVLFTCPGISHALFRLFENDEVVTLPKKVGPQGGLTPAKWEASAEPYVKEWLGDISID